MTYRVEFSLKALGRLGGFPSDALDALITAMADVSDYPADPLTTWPTDDPYEREVPLGDAGFVRYRIDDAAEVVTVIDLIWLG